MALPPSTEKKKSSPASKPAAPPKPVPKQDARTGTQSSIPQRRTLKNIKERISRNSKGGHLSPVELATLIHEEENTPESSHEVVVQADVHQSAANWDAVQPSTTQGLLS